MNEYESAMKDLVKKALMSGDRHEMAKLIRWSGYAIACMLSVSESKGEMNGVLRNVLQAIVVETREIYDWVEKQQRENPAASDPSFAKFMAGVLKEQGNG